MRRSVVLCLAVSFAMFGFGLSLQCYYCPQGVSGNCEVTVECNPDQDTCIRIMSGGTTYSHCTRNAECDATSLSSRTGFTSFTFKCCQSKLCNTEEKSFRQKLKDFFG